MTAHTSRRVLKSELRKRIVHSDETLLPGVFKAGRVPPEYVAGCLALFDTPPVAKAFRNLQNVVDRGQREHAMYPYLATIINAISAFDAEPSPGNPNPAQWANARRTVHFTTKSVLRDDTNPSSINRKPDFVFCEEPDHWQEKLWRLLSGHGEVIRSASRHLGEGKTRTETVMQLADAARAQLSARPFQLFSLALCFCGTIFYATYWDRAGAIFSPGYDLRKRSERKIVVRYLLAYLRGLTFDETGQDPHATMVSPLSAEEYPEFDIEFCGHTWRTVGKPIFQSLSFLGRGTSVWRVRHEEFGVRILKSAWRASNRSPEIDIYRAFDTKLGNDPWPVGVAQYDDGGDVTVTGHPDQPLDISTLRKRAGGTPYDNAILHRVLLKSVGRPLWDYTAPGELLAGLRDAILGHQKMYMCGLLHRDISPGNVLLSEDPEAEGCYGFVTDVEFAKHFTTTPPTTPLAPGGRRWTATPVNSSAKPGAAMSGTMQFMSIALLGHYADHPDRPFLVHQAPHDLESFVWVFIYAILRHEIATRAASAEVEDVVVEEDEVLEPLKPNYGEDESEEEESEEDGSDEDETDGDQLHEDGGDRGSDDEGGREDGSDEHSSDDEGSSDGRGSSAEHSDNSGSGLSASDSDQGSAHASSPPSDAHGPIGLTAEEEEAADFYVVNEPDDAPAKVTKAELLKLFGGYFGHSTAHSIHKSRIGDMVMGIKGIPEGVLKTTVDALIMRLRLSLCNFPPSAAPISYEFIIKVLDNSLASLGSEGQKWL